MAVSTVIDILFLFIANIIFFHRVIFFDRFLNSTSELLANFFPLSQYSGWCLRQGFFPLWDPYYYHDFVGVSFPGVFYPFNILVSYFGSFMRMNNAFLLMHFVELFHFFLGSLFMYLLIVHITKKREGAILGALSFIYSGFLVKGLQQTVIIQTMVWFPLIFLFFIKGMEGKYRYSIFSGMALAMAFLAGYLSITIYGCIILLFYCLWSMISEPRKSIPYILATALTFLVAFGLGAVQILPTFQYAQHSIRLGSSYDTLVLWGSLPPMHFLTLFIPHFFGGAGAIQWADKLVDLGFWELVYYCGIFAVVFGILGLYLNVKRPVRRMQYFLFFVLVFSIFMMMGKYSFMFGLCYALKFFPLSRIPGRWGFFLAFSLSALGGIGFGYLCQPLKTQVKKNITALFDRVIKPYSLWLILAVSLLMIPLRGKGYFASINNIAHFLIFYLAAVLFLALRLKTKFKPSFVKFAIAVVFLDLFFASSKINPIIPYAPPPAPPENFFKDDARVKFLQNDHDIFRVSGLSWPFTEGQANRIFTLGYLGGFSLSRFAEFRGETDPMGSGGHSWFQLRPDISSQIIDFYNIKYLFSDAALHELDSARYEGVKGFSNLYRNKKCFPRVFLVPDFEVVKDDKKILPRMQEIDLSKKVILEESPSIGNSSNIPGQSSSDVAIQLYSPLKIKIVTTTARQGFLVLSEMFYPGWKGYIDGKRQKIYRANYVFRSLVVPAGRHEIEFRYDPLVIKAGFIITSATILFLAIVLIRIKTRKYAN